MSGSKTIFGQGASAIPSVPRATPQKKSGRLLTFLFHGTSRGGVSRSKGTPLPGLFNFISLEVDPVKFSSSGFGTSGEFFDTIKAALGIGGRKFVVLAYKSISDNYRQANDFQESDRLLFAGFSRGCDTAIKVVKLINVFGIVQDGDDKLYRRLFNLCATTEPWKSEEIDNVKQDYQWIDDVPIHELLLFDAVSTFGIPPTGIGRFLRILPFWSKQNSHLVEVPSNVQHTSHVIVLHDPRAPYEHTTFCIPMASNQVLRQIYFAGRHSDSMSTGPMAWQIQNLKTDLSLKFNESRLHDYFHSPYPNKNNLKIPEWVFKPIKPINCLSVTVLGTKPRMPGRRLCPGTRITETATIRGMVTNEEVHSSVRHRGYGRIDDEKPVEGFHLESDPETGRQCWVQNRVSLRRPTTNQIAPPLRIQEAKVGEYEMMLSNLPAN